MPQLSARRGDPDWFNLEGTVPSKNLDITGTCVVHTEI